MAFKIALFAALCVAQALAFQSSAQPLPRDVISKFFDVEDRKIMGVILKCTEAQTENFEVFAKRITDAFRQALSWIDPQDRKQVREEIQTMSNIVDNMSYNLKEFPNRIYPLLEQNEFKKVLDEIFDTERAVDARMDALYNVKRRMIVKVLDLAEPLEEMMAWIDRQFSRGQKMITDSFVKCLYYRAPKTLA